MSFSEVEAVARLLVTALLGLVGLWIAVRVGKSLLSLAAKRISWKVFFLGVGVGYFFLYKSASFYWNKLIVELNQLDLVGLHDVVTAIMH